MDLRQAQEQTWTREKGPGARPEDTQKQEDERVWEKGEPIRKACGTGHTHTPTNTMTVLRWILYL